MLLVSAAIASAQTNIHPLDVHAQQANTTSANATSANATSANATSANATSANTASSSGSYAGINMRGQYTNKVEQRDVRPKIPANYYDDSFKAISQSGMNLVRYLFTWEAYEKNPSLFINELNTVAKTADKWGLKLIYTNDQYHTSSWLDPDKGYGFPSMLFTGSPTYPKDSWPDSAEKWWTDLFNRSIKDSKGVDAWTLQADFLKKIVSAVNNHKSTLGYEILNEPHVYSIDQWEKVGSYNTFIADQLRKVTQKTIVFDRQDSPDLGGPVGITPENIAKMAPDNKNNVIMKVTLFGVPTPGTDAGNRLDTYVKAAQIAGVPLCVCEFNIKQYGKDKGSLQLIDQKLVNLFVEKFKESKLWGWAIWIWDFSARSNANYNLVSFKSGTMETSQNFDYIKNAIANNK